METPNVVFRFSSKYSLSRKQQFNFHFTLNNFLLLFLDPGVALGKSTSEKGSSKSQNITDVITELLKAEN